MKKYFEDMFKHVDRPGMDDLLEWMDVNGFFEAPASTKYHLNCKGGLAQHSKNVFEVMLTLMEGLDIPEESVVICGLLHDICKTDAYIPDEYGGYKHNPEAIPLGHGEKSVMLLQDFISLTTDEMLAIRWHMGAWDPAVKGGCHDINNAYRFSKLVALLQNADNIATRIYEEE